ncbi:MAG TPA: hypothetical protein VGE04_17005 [Chloroflexia bacterium]
MSNPGTKGQASQPSDEEDQDALHSSQEPPGLEIIDSDEDVDEESILSLDVILEVARERVKEQNSYIGVLDTKAGFVIGSASLLTAGLAGFFDTVFQSIDALILSQPIQTLPIKEAALLLTASAMLLYLGIAFAGYQAYKLRDYPELSDIRSLRDIYLNERTEDTQLAILDTLTDIVEVNDREIKDKAWWTQLAVVLLIVQAVFIAVLVVVQLLIGAGIIR